MQWKAARELNKNVIPKLSLWLSVLRGCCMLHILPQTHLHPAAVSQTPWHPLCWRQRHRLGADPGSPPSDSPSRGSQTYPARCRLSCAIWQNKYKVSVYRRLDRCRLCLQVRLRNAEELDELFHAACKFRKPKNAFKPSKNCVEDWFLQPLCSGQIICSNCFTTIFTLFEVTQVQAHRVNNILAYRFQG